MALPRDGTNRCRVSVLLTHERDFEILCLLGEGDAKKVSR